MTPGRGDSCRVEDPACASASPAAVCLIAPLAAGLRCGHSRARPLAGHRAPAAPRLRHVDGARLDARGGMALLRAQSRWRRSGVRVPRQSTATGAEAGMAPRGRPAHRPARRLRGAARRRHRARTARPRLAVLRTGPAAAPIRSSCGCATATCASSRCCPGSTCRSAASATRRARRPPAATPRIEALKRSRLDARILGEFEWSLWQRGFDGVRADWTRGPVRSTGVAVRPTQGGFARVAGPDHRRHRRLRRHGERAAPRRRCPHTQLQGFVLQYDDTRRVTQRPTTRASPPHGSTSP